MPKQYDCLECGERLKLHKEGGFANKDDSQTAKAYVCEECDQMYALVDGVLMLAQYDAKGKPIEIFCKDCDAVEHFRQKMVFICNDGLWYHPYCFDCAIQILRNWGDVPREKITRENVEGIANLYSMAKVNALISDPVAYKKAMSDPRIKKAMQEDFGFTDEQMNAAIERRTRKHDPEKEWTKIKCSCGNVYVRGQEDEAFKHLGENMSHIQTPTNEED